jgi:antitoxin PrlF
MKAATLTSKNRLTLPKDVRNALGLGPGDRIDFVRMEDGKFVLMPATQSVRMLKGIVSKSKTPVSFEDKN